jgi:hypothetical protein
LAARPAVTPVTILRAEHHDTQEEEKNRADYEENIFGDLISQQQIA